VIGPQISRLLDSWLRRQRIEGDDVVFPGPGGRSLSGAALVKIVQRAAADAGLKVKPTPHWYAPPLPPLPPPLLLPLRSRRPTLTPSPSLLRQVPPLVRDAQVPSLANSASRPLELTPVRAFSLDAGVPIHVVQKGE